jgi:hypothetical protein
MCAQHHCSGMRRGVASPALGGGGCDLARGCARTMTTECSTDGSAASIAESRRGTTPLIGGSGIICPPAARAARGPVPKSHSQTASGAAPGSAKAYLAGESACNTKPVFM